MAIATRAKAANRRNRTAISNLLVAGLTLAAAAGGATAGVHPTGTAVVDPLYGALLAAAATIAASRANRWTWLVLTGFGVAFARSWLLVPAVAALGGAFASTFDRRRRRRVGALIAAVGVQVVLRWPSLGFEGLTALLAAAAVLPVLISGYANLRRPTRRRLRWVVAAVPVVLIILAIPTVLGALRARQEVTVGLAQATEAEHLLGQGQAAAVTAKLHAAGAEFTLAERHLNNPLTEGSKLVPVVAQQRAALVRGTRVGRHLAAVVGDQAPRVNLSSLVSSGGHLDLPAIEALNGPVRQVHQALDLARHQLSSAPSPWLLKPISQRLAHLRHQINRADRVTSQASTALRVMPAILGADGTRHYFVAFMQPSESRGLDGFIGAFGILTVDGGRISLTRAGPYGTLNTGIRPGTRKIVGQAAYLARYGAFHPADFPQDLTYSPNFPTVAEVISQIYRQSAGGTPIDGVLAVDPYALADLLNFTGPVTIPGLPEKLNAEDAATVLLKQQYLVFEGTGKSAPARHDFLQDALRLVFGRLTSHRFPNPKSLLSDLEPAVRQGRLLFWTDRPREQSALHRLGVDGGFPAARGGDLLAVTTQNAGNNKLDAYIHQAITDTVHIDPSTGSETAKVTVTLHNDAPSRGLPPVVLDSQPRLHLSPGTDDLWLSLYTPLLFDKVQVNGKPALLASNREFGVFAYNNDVLVPAGSTTTLTVDLKGRIRAGRSYRLAVWRQPLVNAEPIEVQVSPSSGWRARTSSTWQVPDRSVERWTLRMGQNTHRA